MAALRALCERLGDMGRLLNHTVIEPTNRDQLDAMPTWRDRYGTTAWKVYTMGRVRGFGKNLRFEDSWMLDDEKTGIPFLERVRESGVKRVCAHKGLSNVLDTGSPRDIGPVAKAFPDIDFMIYHSGYEMPLGKLNRPEGPYTPDTAHLGVNRLLASLEQAGIGAGSNVYAELGTTWFTVLRRPADAAHLLGKLLLHMGEDNVVWGTDSIWYGPPQPAIDAFRAFEIPKSYQDEFGYPELTKERKEKILANNAARVYGIDLEHARKTAESDDLAWVKAAMDEYRTKGAPTL
jgi:predicted TIM-barrel fold metal-dependent hydrolase